MSGGGGTLSGRLRVAVLFAFWVVLMVLAGAELCDVVLLLVVLLVVVGSSPGGRR